MTSRTSGVLSVNFVTNEMDRDAVAVAARAGAHRRLLLGRPRCFVSSRSRTRGARWRAGRWVRSRRRGPRRRPGCDLIAVQGVEAGGHVRGYGALLPLLGAVLDEIELPVLAAGGIGGGRAIAAVLAAGAAGARMGTRFIATDESGAHPAYKQAVVDASAGSTAISDAFAICPSARRVLARGSCVVAYLPSGHSRMTSSAR